MNYNLEPLKKIFEQIRLYSTNAFADLLDHALLPFQYFPTGEALRQAHEKLISYKYREELKAFLLELGRMNPGYCDPLGEFYMMEISHGRLGQYFTPEDITGLMAGMQVDDPIELTGKSVFDPACGSGRTLLALAKMNRNMFFFGADLDLLCCKMTLLNLLLNSLTGEIAHMDSLSNEFFRGYRIGTRILNGNHYPVFEEFFEKEKSRIWLQPVQSTEAFGSVQGNLFDE